jgi:hypothetical protein
MKLLVSFSNILEQRTKYNTAQQLRIVTCVPIARQRLGKHIPAATTAQADWTNTKAGFEAVQDRTIPRPARNQLRPSRQ